MGGQAAERGILHDFCRGLLCHLAPSVEDNRIRQSVGTEADTCLKQYFEFSRGSPGCHLPENPMAICVSDESVCRPCPSQAGDLSRKRSSMPRVTPLPSLPV